MLKTLKILTLILILNTPKVNANTNDELNKLKNNFVACSEILDKSEESCPQKWNYNCHNILMEANKKTQQCYIDVATDLFLIYYNQEQKKTQKMFEEIADFTSKNHLYIYQENNYCKKNNCGISAYLPSQYAATYVIKDYINQTFIPIKNNQ